MHVVNVAVLCLYQLTCFAFAGYMVYLQFEAYFKNRDVSSVSYKRFNDGAEDVYPTLSVCVVSYDGQLFRDSLGDSASSYWKFIRGAVDDNKNYGS